MRIFAGFLKERAREILLYIITLALLKFVFFLYNLPSDALNYGFLLVLVLAGILFFIDFCEFYKRHKELVLVEKNMQDALLDLPEPDTLIENDYQDLLDKLEEIRRKLKSEELIFRQEMQDYYGMWVHQIKTPISAMRMLLQTMEEEYPEDWKQKIIKYIYKRLTQSVRQDRGLGVGFHPLEEYPARTMLVEESIFADRVLSSIESEEKKMNNESYRKALGKVIESSSWNYVECVDNPERIIKLEIIKNHLSQIEVYTRQDLVLCRYIGGLRQIAQYKILKLMGKEDTVAMDILREMPF